MQNIFSRQIGVFGSAFDPPHQGHLGVLRQCVDEFDCVVLVPSARHAFGKQMAPLSIRLAMLQAFVASSGLQDKLVISAIESQLGMNRSEPVYAIEMLEALAERMGSEAELTLIIGPDNADPAVWSRWHRSEEISRRWGLCLAAPAGDIRSTRIRASQYEGKDVHLAWMAPEVAAIMRANRLYQASRS